MGRTLWRGKLSEGSGQKQPGRTEARRAPFPPAPHSALVWSGTTLGLGWAVACPLESQVQGVGVRSSLEGLFKLGSWLEASVSLP